MATLNDRGAVADRIQKALREVSEKIASIEHKYLMADDLSPAVYKSTVTALKKKQIGLQRELNDSNADQKIYWDKLNTVLPLLHDIRQVYETLDLTRKRQF